MREPINKRPALYQNAAINRTQTERQIVDKRMQTGGVTTSYTYNGYKIHERFDPEGPPLADCIVRVLA